MRETAAAAALQPARLYAGRQTDYVNHSRQLVKHGVRNIAVVLHDGRFYAFDNACYHHGGALLRGDIEEMGGHPCIVCPWHSYRITMDTGEGLYVGVELNPGGGKPIQKVKSKGQKQRVYAVTVEADGRVFVEFDATGPKVESDTYAGMSIANQEAATATPIGSAGTTGSRGPRLHSGLGMELRSGHVFQSMHARDAGSGNGRGLSGLLMTGRGGRNPLLGPADAKPFPVSAGEHSPDAIESSSADAHGDPSRRRATPGAGGGAVTRQALRGGDVPNRLAVSCVLIEEVCEGVKQFSFSCHSGAVQRHCERGEYVELELPVRGPDGQPLRRKWTVTDTNHRNTFFTIVVKNAGAGSATSGSAWLHAHALHAPLRVCRVGGTFTMVDHSARIHAHRGRVLWLTAGIGITSAYASIAAALTDDYDVHNTGEPLNILHLHVDRHLHGVAKLPELAALCERFPTRTSLSASTTPQPRQDRGTHTHAEGESGAAKCYTLQVYLTRETERALAVSGLPSSGTSGNGRGGGKEGALKKSRQELQAPLAELAQRRMPAPGGVTCAGRYGCEEIAAAARDVLGGSSSDCVAFVCGPPAFVDMCTSALLSMGVAEADILTDDP